MKRSYSLFNNGSDTSGATPRPLVPPTTVRTGKRVKKAPGFQTDLRAFLNIGTPGETPCTETRQPGAQTAARSSLEWPSAAQRALGALALNTPSTSLPTLSHQLGAGRPAHTSSQVADPWPQTRNDPAPSDPEPGDEDDDFRILSSQTYTRLATQQEPAPVEDTNTSWHSMFQPSSAPALHEEEENADGHLQGSQPCHLHSEAELADDLSSVLTQPTDTAEVVSSKREHMLTPPQALGVAGGKAAVGPAGHEAALNLGAALPTNSGPATSAQAVTPELVPVQMGGPQNEAASKRERSKEADSAKPGLAPLFKPRSQRKMLLLVRHGESEYNKAVNESKSYADPMIFDPHLTQKGVRQCQELQTRLAAMLAERHAEFGEPVWVVSPLTRTLQTFMLCCPYIERLPPPSVPAHTPFISSAPFLFTARSSGGSASPLRIPSVDSSIQSTATLQSLPSFQSFDRPGSITAGQGSGGGSGGGLPGPSRGHSSAAVQVAGSSRGGLRSSFEFDHLTGGGGHRGTGSTSAAVAAAGTPSLAPHANRPPLQVEVVPSCAEFMITPGDVGRPPAHLIREFPQLSEQLSRLPEVWWHHTGSAASCAVNKKWAGGEPSDKRKARVQEFSRWLSARQERLFVLVGHSCFWHTFTGKQHDRLRNCEVLCLTW